MTGRGGVLLLFAGLAGAGTALAFDGPAAPLRAPAPSGVSWEESDSLARKVLALEKRLRERSTRPETVLVTQGELNSYLTLAYASKMPKGVTGVSVRIHQDRIEAEGSVDLDQVGASQAKPKSRWSLTSLLAPTVPVLLRGRLINQNGFGTLEWEEIKLSALPLPIRALEEMVAAATKGPKYPNGWDMKAPFRLPYAARRIRLEPGRAFLDF
jgi:hypothetical protein